MSEGNVALIRDEDLLRRMWQQTDDFSKKKEIRAHMYRLREERLRDLYSPEPREKKGCEFTMSQDHTKSFAGQNFQSMKSKEVRDASSPPKEFTYHGQDLKELSNAGWNVESNCKTSDDGHTHTKSMGANIEGTYDVDGGKGQFSAVDQHRQAVSEYQDANTSLKEKESASKTAAHEQVFKQTDDGSTFSSSSMSSTATSKYQKSSSSKDQSLPYPTDMVDNVTHSHLDQTRENKTTLNQNSKATNVTHQNIGQSELVSRKVQYPDQNTKVITETRAMPDGTIVTSTRKETKDTVVQRSNLEQQSQQSEHKSESFTSTLNQAKEISSKTTKALVDNVTRNTDETLASVDESNLYKSNNKVSTKSHHDKHDKSLETTHTEKLNEEIKLTKSNIQELKYDDNKKRYTENDQEKTTKTFSDENKVRQSSDKETHDEQYKTTYQSDFTQKKISQDLSSTHQAWASSLRADSSTNSRPSTRAGSPSSKLYQSSTSSLRSSVSPEKNIRTSVSRERSPSKLNRKSPNRNTTADFSSSRSTKSFHETDTTKTDTQEKLQPSSVKSTSPRISPDRKGQYARYQRQSISPDKKLSADNHEITSGYDNNKKTNNEPKRASPNRHDTSPKRRYTTVDHTTTGETYKFIDEESKMSTRSEKNIDFSNKHYQRYSKDEMESHETNNSLTRKSPPKNTAANLPSSLRKDSPIRRSPSPPKGPVTFQSDSFTKKTNKDESTKIHDTSKTTSKYDIKNDEKFRDKSPSKISLNNTNRNSVEVDYYDNKVVNVNQDSGNSFNCKSRSSVSPVKMTKKVQKYTDSTDFIKKEITSEEINKKNKTERPRQLITPSTSPTRKPKQIDAPSTGQSSPTTSVSEIIYFGSPRQSKDKTVVTDLDDEEYFTNSKTDTHITTQSMERPATLGLTRQLSPTKIPCRSPDRAMSPIKDHIPRKSSLKKSTLPSPVEKPPAAFQVNTTQGPNNTDTHKIVKKDNPDKSNSLPKNKEKPPLERRETYEERCRKILGMEEDITESKTTDVIKNVTQHDVVTNLFDVSSPSISLCSSPTRENSPDKESTENKIGSRSFLIDDDDNERKKTFTKTADKVLIKSRDNSPAKLKDIMTESNTSTKNKIKQDIVVDDVVIKTQQTKYDTSDKTQVNDKSKIESNKRLSPSRLSTNKQTAHSSIKKTNEYSVDNNEFINTEREQEVLEKVQNSLRKLSPNRDNIYAREKSPNKKNTVLENLETLIKTEKGDTVTQNVGIHSVSAPTHRYDSNESKETHTRVHEPRSKFPSRNVSSVKKPATVVNTFTKTDKSTGLETTSIDRNKSSRKLETPISLQDKTSTSTTLISKPCNLKSKESGIPNKQKPISSQTHTTKSNKCVTDTLKKTTTITKQNSATNIKSKIKQCDVTSHKPAIPSNTECRQRKDIDNRITRTVSDNSIKNKKNSPQRMRSKPEIQVNNTFNTKTTAKQNVNIVSATKHGNKDVTKLTNKPKSATSLNMSTYDNDVIIDIQQAKSSRENSPDRICPTPVNLSDDIGKLRLPDDVSEPDDDIGKRSYHTIHETESIVDDIVEITEDEELFLKKSNVDNITESDECLLSVTDKVSKFSHTGPKSFKNINTTKQFKDTEKYMHSDYLSKISKNDNTSVSKNISKISKDLTNDIITDHYDNSKYQDNYTNSSVHDKAHFFIETAENAAASPKPKPLEKVLRPDFSNVDESLKSDDCLLSVTDKVNKFIKTAEQFLSETNDKNNVIANKEKVHTDTYDSQQDRKEKVKINTDNVHEKIDDSNYYHKKNVKEESLGSFANETVSSHAKVKDHLGYNLKPHDRAAPVKINPLRSSESVKKAKALFENIASTQKPEGTPPSTKLMDIGVIRKSPKTDSTTVLHPSVEDGLSTVTTSDLIYSTTSDTTYKSNLGRTNKEPKHRLSPTRSNRSPVPTYGRQKSPTKQVVIKDGSPNRRGLEADKPLNRQTPKINNNDYSCIEDNYEVSSRRGSGKFGVELRRTSVESSTSRRSSGDHHQPCIEDIYDLELLEQMLEKVVGYEQRRRVRAQMRVAKKRIESEKVFDSGTYTKNKTYNKTDYIQVARNSKVHDVSNLQKSQEHSAQFLNGHDKDIEKGTKIGHRNRSPDKAIHKPIILKTKRFSPEKRNRTQSPTKVLNKPTSNTNRFSEYASAYLKKVGVTDTEHIKSSEIKEKLISSENGMDKIEKTNQSSSVTSQTFTKRSSSKDVILDSYTNTRRSPSPDLRAKRTQSSNKKPESDRLYHRSPSPDFKRPRADSAKIKQEYTIKTVYEAEKKTQPKPTEDVTKPSWVTNRNLKNITSDTRSFTSKKIENKKPYRAQSPSKVISKPIDVITSSYGPGPLDADGRPLFGIKALRNGASNYQVKGTMIRQEFHSHNGGEPEGTVSVTAYSNNAEDLEKLLRAQDERPSRMHGLAAITTTKKFGGQTGTTMKEAHGMEDRALLEHFTNTKSKVEDTSYSNHKTTMDSNQTRRSNVQIKELNQHNTEDRRIKGKSETQHKEEKRTEEKRTESKKMEGKKTVRQSSVKSLTEKYIKNATDTSKSDRSAYPKAGLILRTATLKDSVSSDSSNHEQGLRRTDSDRSINSTEGNTFMQTSTTTQESTEHGGRRTTTTTKTQSSSRNYDTTSQKSHLTTKVNEVNKSNETGKKMSKNEELVKKTERSFLDSSTKVTGVKDILTRMKNADIVVEDGDSNEDAEARALLNKFLGATVLMAGMQGYVKEAPAGRVRVTQETVERRSRDIDIDNCWDERVLRQLLEECTEYEERRRIRVRIRALMAEQEACAGAVAEALGVAEEPGDAREEEITTVTSSVRRNSSEKTVSSTVENSKVIENMTRPAPKSASPFAKFRQLEKQNSLTNPSSPKTPQSPGSPSQPYFKFTDPALACSAMTIKERLLQWCRDKTRDYENVKLENFSTSWSDGLAFCALVHHFLPDAFDYSKLTSDKRRHNFTLAFKVADEKAGIYPLLDVDDMVAMRKPDWKCVFTYVQAIYRRFKDQD